MAKNKISKASTQTKVELKPTAGYLLIEPLDPEKKTASGIYLPETNSEKPQKGKVLAVGEAEIKDSGTKKESPAKLNDIVVYKKWGANEVKVGNIEYLFVKFEDILAIEI